VRELCALGGWLAAQGWAVRGWDGRREWRTSAGAALASKPHKLPRGRRTTSFACQLSGLSSAVDGRTQIGPIPFSLWLLFLQQTSDRCPRSSVELLEEGAWPRCHTRRAGARE